MSTPEREQALLEEAAQWLERARRGTAQDRSAFRAWLEAAPEHVAAMDLVERAWRRAPEALRGVDLRQRTRPQAIWLQWAGSALATGLAAIALWLGWGGMSTEQHFAASGAQVAMATLPDGSRVWMTPGSRIDLHYTPLRRDLRLTGEASFDVKHGWRQFAVSTGSVRIVDLGTVFSIAQRGGQTAVVLAHGAIDIMDTAQGSLIASPSPGQQVIIAGNSATIETVDAEAALAWRDGHLVVRDMPLSAVVERYAQLGGAHIRISDPRIGALRVYGTYRIGEAEGLLQAMSALYPITWQRTGVSYEVHRR